MMWALLFIFMVHLEAASGKEIQEPTRPDHMMEYLLARDKCTFERVKGIKGGCGIDVQACEVEATLVEGSGYYRFTRFGPFTSTGGTQKMGCNGKIDAFGAPAETYMTRSMATAIEPYTGMQVSYPPIHLHHAHLFEGGYLPPIPDEIKKHMPWLIEGLTGSASSEECLHAVGGTSCYNVMVPAGHAIKRYSDGGHGDYQVYLEDARKMGSPPMSTSVEFGSFILTKPNPALPPPKSAVPVKFSVGDRGHLGTYAVPYNTENYQVGTFYIPVKMEMTPFKIHLHGTEGDEVWTIRGTQEDLGVPEHLRSPIALAADAKENRIGQTDHHNPVDLPEEEPLDMWKAWFEKSMSKAGAAWERRAKTTTTKKGKKESSGSNSGSQSSYFVPFDENDPQPMRSKPEILCKYFSVAEHVTPEWIAADKAELRNLTTNGGHQHFTSEDAPYSRFDPNDPFPTFKPNHDAIGPDGYVVPGTVNTDKAPRGKSVSQREQYQNMFEGVLPGIYYRHPRSALLEKEHKYTQCGTVVFEVGDYLTLLGLNVKRKNPEFDSAEFYNTPLKNQHTIFAAIAHLPDVPWFH